MTDHNPQIQIGDLVRMKYISFWQKKRAWTKVPYTEVPLLVMELYANAIKVMFPDGSIKTDLAEYYEALYE